MNKNLSATKLTKIKSISLSKPTNSDYALQCTQSMEISTLAGGNRKCALSVRT